MQRRAEGEDLAGTRRHHRHRRRRNPGLRPCRGCPGPSAAENPHLQYELISGNGEDLSARLRAGSLDICLFIGPSRYEDFDYVDLPTAHTWGLVLKADEKFRDGKRVNAIREVPNHRNPFTDEI